MAKRWLLIVLGVGIGAFLLRAVRESQIPPRDLRPKRPPPPRRRPDADVTWARFDDEEPERG